MEDLRGTSPVQEIRMAAEENRRMVNTRTGEARFHFPENRDGFGRAPGGAFSLRLFLAMLLFAGFCFMEREERHIGDYDSSAICQIIQEDMDFSKVFKGRL